MGPLFYNVDPKGREPLLEFIVRALERNGCRILHRPPPDKAPYQITFEDPKGQRLGIVAYAFTANTRHTKNRPEDEHRFQLKYVFARNGVLKQKNRFLRGPAASSRNTPVDARSRDCKAVSVIKTVLGGTTRV